MDSVKPRRISAPRHRYVDVTDARWQNSDRGETGAIHEGEPVSALLIEFRFACGLQVCRSFQMLARVLLFSSSALGEVRAGGARAPLWKIRNHAGIQAIKTLDSMMSTAPSKARKLCKEQTSRKLREMGRPGCV